MTKLWVDVIRNHGAFLAIAREWDALVERAGIEHPFLSHDWVRTWWECFGTDKELYVLSVRAGAELVGLAPLMRTRTRMYGVPVWRLEFIANVHTPRFDFIVAQQADEVYAAILDYLQTQDPRWDVVMLPELGEHSRTDRELRRLAGSRSLRTGVWIAGASPRIPLVGSFESFSAALSAKRRGSLRQRLRRLTRVGTVSLEVVDGPERLVLALQDGLRMEAASWKGVAGTAISRHEDLTRFYGLIAERAARSETLSLLFLKVGDKRIAFAYCLRRGRALYLLKTGYDPEYASYSPFNALLFFVIEAAFRQGLEVIDLLGSEEPWKSAWTDQRTERKWFFLYRNNARALLIYYLKFMLLPRLRGKRRHYPALEAAHGRSSSPTAPKLVSGAQP